MLSNNLTRVHLLIGLLITLFCNTAAWSHQPDQAAIIISKTADGKVILQINSSLTAFQTEVNYHFGKEAYSSPEAFRALVVQHFEKTFSMLANGSDTLQFINSLVVLGHETKYVTEIKGLPTSLNALQINNTFFKEIYNNQAVVALLLTSFPEHKNYAINRDTQYQLNLEYADGAWQIVEPTDTKKYLYYLLYFISFAAFALFIYYFAVRKRRKV